MKILMCHTRYQIRGGEDESVDTEVALLRLGGHTVNALGDDNRRIEALSKLTMARDTVWSTDAARRIRAQLAAERYDIVHVQNFFPLLSPSIHYAASAAGVPVVQSLRNYRLACANGMFFRDGMACETCVGTRTLWPSIVHRCYRGDRAATAVLTASTLTHRLLGTWSRRVHAFITPSEFTRRKMVEIGIPEDCTFVKPNTISVDLAAGSGTGNFALYVGRLAPEKGVATLLEAWTAGRAAMPLLIVGDGPLVDDVRRATIGRSDIVYLGRQPIEEAYRLMGDAAVVIIPTVGYETFGRVVVEAYARGTPVIAARTGPLPELVQERVTGWLVEPGDARALRSAVDAVRANPKSLSVMRRAARQAYEDRYAPARNLEVLVSIYHAACRNAVRAPDEKTEARV